MVSIFRFIFQNELFSCVSICAKSDKSSCIWRWSCGFGFRSTLVKYAVRLLMKIPGMTHVIWHIFNHIHPSDCQYQLRYFNICNHSLIELINWPVHEIMSIWTFCRSPKPLSPKPPQSICTKLTPAKWDFGSVRRSYNQLTRLANSNIWEKVNLFDSESDYITDCTPKYVRFQLINRFSWNFLSDQFKSDIFSVEHINFH